MMSYKHLAALSALAMAACQAEPGTATENAAATIAENTASVEPAAPQPQPQSSSELRLSGPAGADAIAAVEAEAARQQMTRVKIASSQSFAVTENGRTVATLVTGEGNMPDTTLNGCFVATQQGSETMLIPTVGYGNYELEPCGGPIAVGILSSGPMPKLGFVFRSYSRESEETVPVVVEWDRSNNTLLIDEQASEQAGLAGVKTIAQMRKLAK